MKIWNGVKIHSAIKPVSPQTTQQKNEQHSDKRDSVTISDEARAKIGGWRERSANMIENLMEQRQKVQDAKSDLIGRTLEAGEDLSTIKDQVAEFDEQMMEIDGQISMIEMQRREREQQEREDQLKEVVKEQEDAEKVQTTALLASAQSLEQISALKQVKVPIENDHRRLKTELKNDLGRGTLLESKAKKIHDLAGRMKKIDGELSNQVRKAQQATNEMKIKATQKEQQEELFNDFDVEQGNV